MDEFKKRVQELTEKKEKSMRHLRAARVPLERYAQEKESAGSPAEGEEMSLERILVLYEVERHLPPPVLGRYRGGGCTPELFRVWTRGVLDKDEENMRIVRFLRKVIPEILRKMGVRSKREEGSMVPISTPRATGEGEEKDRRKREQGRNKQDEEVTKAQQKEDPPPLEQRPRRMEQGMMANGGNSPFTALAATEETTPAPQKETWTTVLGKKAKKAAKKSTAQDKVAPGGKMPPNKEGKTRHRRKGSKRW